jgi:hypothetical protein
MKRLFVLSLFLFSVSLFAQSTIDFETVGQDFVWTIFANGPSQDSTDYAVVANPSASGINTSSQVGKYFVRADADPWAGIFTDDLVDFTLTADNSQPTVMVYKDVISNFNIKLEGPSVNHDTKVPNTVINQWEKLTFDLTADIGKLVTRLTIIPDFPDTRTSGSTNYFDNIEFVHAPVPVELTSFRASVGDNGVELTWTTATELNNVGFDIERRAADATHFDKIGFVKGQGTTTNISSYTFVDRNAAGKLFYRLKQLDQNGTFDFSKTIEVDATKLVKFELSQNYPNPFNPTTTITYSVPQNTFVTLKIYNILGSEVAELVNGQVDAGVHKVNFNAYNLNSGVYFYTIKAGNFSETKKLTLMK